MTDWYEVRRTPIYAGERIQLIPRVTYVDNRPQLRRETEEFMAGVDRLRARVERLPSMQRLRERQAFEAMMAAFERDREREALRVRLDAIVAQRARS
jgi:hypothetical protein